MSVQLEIEDGSPQWYLSASIWTVPGNDPEGSPGLPIVGTPCFLWARVRNTGSTPVQNATVRFYWANPSVGFDRNSANLIGSSFVSLNAGETADVLCLTPWVPVYVNDGHECVLAEAFHSVDPLPAGPAFNVPTDRHVAQRNLSVIMTSDVRRMMFHLAFQLHNTSRKPRVFQLSIQQGKLGELKGLQERLGKGFKLPAGEGKLAKAGFILTDPCPDREAIENAKPNLERIEVPGNASIGVTLVGQLTGESALVHVEQKADGQVMGGLSALVIAEKPGAEKSGKTDANRQKGAQ